jgi:hypothetical protein
VGALEGALARGGDRLEPLFEALDLGQIPLDPPDPPPRDVEQARPQQRDLVRREARVAKPGKSAVDVEVVAREEDVELDLVVECTSSEALGQSSRVT